MRKSRGTGTTAGLQPASPPPSSMSSAASTTAAAGGRRRRAGSPPDTSGARQLNSGAGRRQRGQELVSAVPGQAVLQGRANERMPERVALIPFLQDVPPQRAVERVEERRGGQRRFKRRRRRAELAQRDLRAVGGGGQGQ